MTASISESITARPLPPGGGAPIFIGGAPRSGTTLVRATLDCHPNIACGPESRVTPMIARMSSETEMYCGGVLSRHYGCEPGDIRLAFQELTLAMLERYRVNTNKVRLAEKTPANALYFLQLRRLFPDSPFIHVIRDGRDVVSSLLSMEWRDSSGRPLEITQDAASAAKTWVAHIEAARGAAASAPHLFYELRYEDIVCRQRETLRGLFDYIGEPWSDQVLRFYESGSLFSGQQESSASQVSRPLYRNSIGRWRSALTARQKQAVKREANDFLVALGYSNGHDW